MNISIAITNHNQSRQVRETIKLLKKQLIQPFEVIVLSDGKPFNIKDVTCINNAEKKGRCDNRNSVIPYFLSTESDALVFIDGDSYPKNKDFIENYIKLLSKHDLVFGTREHTKIKGIEKPASDILTANMDELWQKKKLNYTDLRVVSGAVKAFQEAETFNDRLDLILTGMIGWSCNFAITRNGIEKLTSFMKDKYGIEDSIFDGNAFSGTWGYEDVAMSLDALYAGLNVWISDDVEIYHCSHERTDGLFDHVKGKHVIMERYRKLARKEKDNLYTLLMLTFGFFIIGIITGLITCKCFM